MTLTDTLCLLLVVLGGGGVVLWVLCQLPRAVFVLLGLVRDE